MYDFLVLFLLIKYSFFQARSLDAAFISLETLNTLLDSLGMVVMEVATCTLPRSSWGSIVLEILQWLCLHRKIHRNLKFFTILW